MLPGIVKRWYWAALLIFLGGLLFAYDRRDPRVDGERLSVWFERSLMQGHGVAPREEAEPFRRLGGRGAAWLAQELHQQAPLWVRAHEFLYLRLGRWISIPLPSVTTRDPRIQLARQLLGHFEPSVAGPILVRRFNHCHAGDRAAVAEALGELGPEAADRVGPCLVSALASTNSAELAATILALGEVLYRPEEVLPKLVPFLTNSYSLVRIEATYTMGTYVADPVWTMKPLLERLSDSDNVVKANGARALGRMKGGARPTVDPLINSLRAAELPAPVVARALEALSSIAPEVLRSASAEMDEWVTTKVPKDPYFEVMAATARERLGVQVPTLTANCLRLAQSSKAYVRWEALERLGECGSGTQDVRAALTAGLSDPNGLVRRTAQQALEQWSRRHADAAAQRSTSPPGRAEE